jgi:hypothetical protein
VYFLSMLSASYLNFFKAPFKVDSLILPNNLNKYRQKWISLISCLDIAFITSFLSYGLVEIAYISVVYFVVLKDTFYVFFDEGVFVFWKLNFENNWFLGEVKLVFNLIFLSWFCMFDFVSMRIFEGTCLNVYFLSS